jgi:hypothetical protein
MSSSRPFRPMSWDGKFAFIVTEFALFVNGCHNRTDDLNKYSNPPTPGDDLCPIPPPSSRSSVRRFVRLTLTRPDFAAAINNMAGMFHLPARYACQSSSHVQPTCQSCLTCLAGMGNRHASHVQPICLAWAADMPASSADMPVMSGQMAGKLGQDGWQVGQIGAYRFEKWTNCGAGLLRSAGKTPQRQKKSGTYRGAPRCYPVVPALMGDSSACGLRMTFKNYALTRCWAVD